MNKTFAFLIVAASMVLYDILAATASRYLLIEYAHFALGSYLLNFLAGSLVSFRFGFWSGVLAGLIAGLIESTLGLAASILIGPTTIYDYSIATAADLGFIVVFVSALSTLVGAVGSIMAYFVRKFM